MANKDKDNDNEKDYIDSLQNFSKAIQLYTKTIIAESKKGKNVKNATGSSKEKSGALLNSAKQLNVIEKNTEETKSDSKKILSILKSNNKKKKKGVMDTLSSKDKAKNIKSSIKTIILMAGGVLAIGAAFKIIGEVDFKSVLALSIALPAVAFAFKMVGESSNGPKEASLTALSMIAMSAGIAGSAFLLQAVPAISFGSLLTSIGVSIAMGIAMYGMSMAIENLDDNSLKKLYLTVPLLPVIAAGIVGAGLVLQNMPILTLAQVLSTAGVGIAMGASLIPLAIAGKMLGGKTADVLQLALIMPVMAGSLVISANILQNMPKIDAINILEGALTVGASTLAMAGTIWAISKMKLSIKDAVLGTLSTIVMSTGLMVMSQILNLGNYSNFPDYNWAVGVGLSMLGYLPAVLITGAIAATGFGALVILAGIASMIAVSAGLVATSHILAKGKYTGGPTVEWATGTGAAIMAFVDPILKLNPSLAGMLLGDSLSTKIDMIEKIGTGLKKSSFAIAGGNYTGGPDVKWAKGVGLSLISFAATMEMVEPGLLDKLIFGTSLEDKLNSMVTVAETLPKIGDAVAKGKGNYTGGPKPEWAEGSAAAILAFASALDKVDTGWFSSNLDEQLDGMVKIAEVLPKLGDAVAKGKGNYTGGPEKDWAEAVSTTVVAFGSVLSDIQPGAFSNKTLQGQLDGMVLIAGTLPKIGDAIANGKGNYTGGPNEKWSTRISKSILSFVEPIESVTDNLYIGDVADYLTDILLIGYVMKKYAEYFTDSDFSNYPSIKWTKGMTSFISNFTSIKGIKNTKNASTEIYRLARAYNTLTKSLSGIGKVMSNMPKEMPNVAGLYSGLVTLSLIDDSKLDGVLDALDDHQVNLSSNLNAIMESSNVKSGSGGSGGSGGGMFSGIFDFANVVTGKIGSLFSGGSSSGSSSTTATPQPTTQEITLDTTKLEEKVETLSALLNQEIALLNTIVTNTEKEEEPSKLPN